MGPLDMGSSFIVSRAVLCLPRTLSKMERCEEKIRYRTAAGASWAERVRSGARALRGRWRIGEEVQVVELELLDEAGQGVEARA